MGRKSFFSENVTFDFSVLDCSHIKSKLITIKPNFLLFNHITEPSDVERSDGENK